MYRAEFTSDFEMPVIEACDTVPECAFVAYDKIALKGMERYGIHFFNEDYKIHSAYTYPMRTFDRLKKHPFVIGLDLSIQDGMPLALKWSNSFKNKLVSAWWQRMGLNVVPNVAICDDSTAEMCFNGYPENSVIAINSMGSHRYYGGEKRFRWCYDKIVERLNPKHILRYGAMYPWEDDSKSTQMPNSNLILRDKLR